MPHDLSALKDAVGASSPVAIELVTAGLSRGLPRPSELRAPASKPGDVLPLRLGRSFLRLSAPAGQYAARRSGGEEPLDAAYPLQHDPHRWRPYRIPGRCPHRRRTEACHQDQRGGGRRYGGGSDPARAPAQRDHRPARRRDHRGPRIRLFRQAKARRRKRRRCHHKRPGAGRSIPIRCCSSATPRFASTATASITTANMPWRKREHPG